MFDVHVDVKDLPSALQGALREMGYFGHNVPLEPVQSYNLNNSAGEGGRGLVAVVDLSTGKTRHHAGSWGGANPWEKTLVDTDREDREMQQGQAIIKGTESGRTGNCSFAFIQLHEQDYARLAPAKEEDSLTPRQKKILYVFCSIRGGHRQEYLDRGRVEKWEILQLEELGYLKINRAGAVSSTTKARNVRRGGSYVSVFHWTDEEMRVPEKVEIEKRERAFAVEGASVHTDDSGDGVSLWITFPDKPPLYVRNEMKAHGFVWSRDRRAWVPTIKTYKKFDMNREAVLAFARKFVPATTDEALAA